jgi:hypothetical protein
VHAGADGVGGAGVTLRGGEVSVDRARQATTAHAESWLGWLLCAEAIRSAGDEKAAQQALEEALRRAAENPTIRLKDKLEGRPDPSPGHG